MKLLLLMHQVQVLDSLILPKQKLQICYKWSSKTYYDNVEKFANVSGSGATVYGTFTADTLSVSGISTFQSHVHLGDDDEPGFGDSNDLKIFHNGSHSVIRDEGTGILFLQGDTGK